MHRLPSARSRPRPRDGHRARPEPRHAPPPAPVPVPTGAEAEKTVYAVGLMLWRNLERLDLTPAEIEIVKKAITDAHAGKAEVKLEDYTPRIDAFARDRMQKRTEAEKAKSKAYARQGGHRAGRGEDRIRPDLLRDRRRHRRLARRRPTR